jgi:hypothetical protein
MKICPVTLGLGRHDRRIFRRRLLYFHLHLLLADDLDRNSLYVSSKLLYHLRHPLRTLNKSVLHSRTFLETMVT